MGIIASLGAETLYSIIGFQVMAPIFGWDRTKCLYAALWQGPTRGLPTIFISKKWGGQPLTRTVIRQAAMLLTVTNSSAVTTKASSKESKLSGWEMGEIALFNLFLTGAVLMIPKG